MIQTKGFYRITKVGSGKCTFALFFTEDDSLSKEMGVFDSEKAARKTIKDLQSKGQGAKAENRVNGGETIPSPKFVLDVNKKGGYRYCFLDENENVLLQSVRYLNENTCLADLKKTMTCITTEEIVMSDITLNAEVPEVIEPIDESFDEDIPEETPA